MSYSPYRPKNKNKKGDTGVVALCFLWGEVARRTLPLQSSSLVVVEGHLIRLQKDHHLPKRKKRLQPVGEASICDFSQSGSFDL